MSVSCKCRNAPSLDALNVAEMGSPEERTLCRSEWSLLLISPRMSSPCAMRMVDSSRGSSCCRCIGVGGHSERLDRTEIDAVPLASKV